MKGPVTCRRRGPLRGSFEVPGDKSVSHRSLIFAALAGGETRVRGLLRAEDVHSTWRAVERLGAWVREEGAEVVVTPPERLAEPDDVIDCGNSGTSLRLLAGVLAGVPGLSVLTGDASLRRRPVRRVVEPLRRMGGVLEARDGDRLPPLVIRGQRLRGTRHVLAVASAQVKSAILLAGLSAEGETVVEEPALSRDHTERMLRISNSQGLYFQAPMTVDCHAGIQKPGVKAPRLKGGFACVSSAEDGLQPKLVNGILKFFGARPRILTTSPCTMVQVGLLRSG